MPSHKTTPETVTLLSPQLLAQTRSGTARTWAARALCVGTHPELFFPPGDGPAIEARHISRCALFAASAWRTRSWPTSRSASGAASIRTNGRTCAGSFSGGNHMAPHALEARRDAGTTPLAGKDRRERPVVAPDGPRRPGRGSTCRDPFPPGAASRSPSLLTPEE